MTMIPYNAKYGNYRTRTFAEVFPDPEEFLATAAELQPLVGVIDDDASHTNLTLIYLLLYGKYGESHIATSNEDQFAFRLFGMIGSYAPAMIKKKEVQEKLFSLSEAQIREGATQKVTHGWNPSTVTTDVTNVDDQRKINYSRGTLEGYSELLALIDEDLYESFLRPFGKLFIKITAPQVPLWYATDREEEDDQP